MRSAFFKSTKNMEEQNIEQQAGSTLLGKGYEFQVKGLLRKKVTLKMPPLTAGTIARISTEITKLDEINEQNSMSQELLSKGNNIKVIASCIAYALINQEFFKRWKFWYYRTLILRCDLTEIHAYWNLLKKRSSHEHFFFIMTSTPAMNYLKKKNPQAKSGEAVQSGDPLH